MGLRRSAIHKNGWYPLDGNTWPTPSGGETHALSEHSKLGFVDTVATTFLRRRLHSRRLRAAAARGLKAISTDVVGRPGPSQPAAW
jgi:hypothetical protein